MLGGVRPQLVAWVPCSGGSFRKAAACSKNCHYNCACRTIGKTLSQVAMLLKEAQVACNCAPIVTVPTLASWCQNELLPRSASLDHRAQ